MDCNHVWRDTPLPIAKNSKEALLTSVINSGSTGWWLHDGEFLFAQQLFDEGFIRYCDGCGPHLAIFSTVK